VRSTGSEQGLLKVARQVSETIGTEFFSLLVNKLGEVLGAECVYIGEFLRGRTDRVRTLAAWMEGRKTESFEFPLAGTPDAEVAKGTPCMCGTGALEAFPEDSFLRDLEAQAWVGVPLNNSEGQICGVFAALYRQPLQLEADFVQSMLMIFASRASAELDRKQADDLLRESEERYRAFVRMNPDACWRVELDEPVDTALPEEEQVARIVRSGYIAEGNDALARHLGLTRPDELVGAAVTDVVQDQEFLHNCLRALIRSGYRQSTLEATVVDRNGKRGTVLHCHWGIIEDGKVRRIWGSNRDMTELRSIEAQFRHAQKMDSLGTLAAGVAHDFNNLLTVIQGYSSQLLEPMKNSDDAYMGLTQIRKAAEKGAALTNQLLAFSRKQSSELQPLDLTSIVAEDEQMVRRLIAKDIELKTEFQPSVGLVRANPGFMHQVILNLTVNARDAMPNGGKLLIRLSNVDIGESRPPRLAAVEPGPYVRLTVTDTGMGMSSDVQAHLFEPFFTTKGATNGTGLGLSTVYGIIRQCSGYITVETGPNEGTTFEIFLPRDSSRTPSDPTGPNAHASKTDPECPGPSV
jgi:PAS domain S-box-containing protein